MDKSHKLPAIAARVAARGKNLENPSVYFKPNAHTVSSKTAKNKISQLIRTPVDEVVLVRWLC